jgi:hypothetical protein
MQNEFLFCMQDINSAGGRHNEEKREGDYLTWRLQS